MQGLIIKAVNSKHLSKEEAEKFLRVVDACIDADVPVPDSVLEELGLEYEETPIRNFLEISNDSSIQDIKEEISKHYDIDKHRIVTLVTGDIIPGICSVSIEFD